jgi:hypothetical protein
MKNYKLLILIFGCITLFHCGYHLTGTASTVPKGLKSICIPDFKNLTVKFNADKFISSAIRDEFILRTKLVLLSNRSKADALIEGAVNEFKVTAVSYSARGEGNVYEINIKISIKFINLRDSSIIYERSKISFTDSYKIDSGDPDSLENQALQRVAKKFASNVVSTIFSGIK